MGIEDKINEILQKYPLPKKIIKRIYQFTMYSFSSKIKSEGDIRRLTPNDEYEYFFGYYDKTPWDADEEKLLCLRVLETTSSPAPKNTADIILIDYKTGEIEKIAETNTWNVQQGAMLQWLGPDYKEKIIYNDFRENQFISIIQDITTGNQKILNEPVYSVASDGTFGLTLDFARLHRLRPGYGYGNKTDKTSGENIPNRVAIHKINFKDNTVSEVLTYKDFYNFEQRSEMVGAEHKVNHIMINPSGNRFMVLHRWIKDSKKYTRLITCNVDGTELFNLSDDNMVSHCYWKNDNEIIAFARKKEYGSSYFLLKDKSGDFQQLWPDITMDGHPNYSSESDQIVIDTYPDRTRMQKLYVLSLKEKKYKPKARVFAPFKYDNDYRCDLHPRWNRRGDKISFDATFEGKRALYELNLQQEDLK